jgi:hypothetical protein
MMILALCFFSAAVLLALGLASAGGDSGPSALTSYTYREDFDSGELRAWASYPPNQDTAYDPYTYPGRIQPRDPARCLVVKCVPPWNEDQSLGAVKLLEMYLDPAFSLKFK